MRVAASRVNLMTASIAVRRCATAASSSVGLGVAPKRATKRRLTPTLDASEVLKPLRDAIPEANAELSTAELERKVDEWSKMSPEELEALYKTYEAQEEAESKVLREDSLYQMDVSLKSRSQAAVKVFWKDVSVVPLDEDHHPGWFAVAVDGRKVKAFESRDVLALPNEALATACAYEYSQQAGHLNKLLMPVTDLCSGAMHVAPQAIASRVDYVMSFYHNDNCYFRAPAIAARQDEMLAPVVSWFSRVFEVDVPRIVGLGHPQIPPESALRVRDALLAMNLNPYQIVALCVVAQFTSSLLLPLALFHRVVDVPRALQINRAEEGHNIDTEGLIKGYHDIREADVVVKICASATAWQLTKDIPMSKCAELPRKYTQDDLENP